MLQRVNKGIAWGKVGGGAAFGLAFWAGAASAQMPAAAPVPTPEAQAMSQTIMDLTNQKLGWQARAIQLQEQVADLNKELAAAKAPPKASEGPKAAPEMSKMPPAETLK